MSDNYAVINGKKIELTKEQIKALNLTFRSELQNPFKRSDGEYYWVDKTGEVTNYNDCQDSLDNRLYNNVNYFNDKAFANQVMLHQLLYRKLLKFAHDNGYDDNQIWDGSSDHWCIYYDPDDLKYCVAGFGSHKFDVVWFSSEDAAERAIKEVVEPFMKAHPEFVW